MNTVQLAQRLARNLAVEDSSNLTSDAALDILNAINAGIASFYREMPAHYKQTTLSQTLRAPDLLVALAFTAKYSNTVAADTFSTAQRGCTLRVTGVRDNEITGPDTVLDDYLGDTLSTTGTVYHDAIALEYVIDRLISEPRIYYDVNQRTPRRLIRNENLRRGWRGTFGVGGTWPTGLPDSYGTCGLGSIGLPRYYYLDYVGGSQGGDPFAYLRVAPMPPADYIVRFEAELGPRPITFAELSAAVRVPVPEQHVADVLIPLCEAELLRSPLWRGGQQATQEVGLARDTALGAKMMKMPVGLAPEGCRVGSRRGW